jgi:hypothetical protein
MPTEGPAEQLYELAQQQLAYERYDMAAEYARQALSFVSDPDLAAKLRVVLQTAEAAESMAMEHARPGPGHGRQVEPRMRRKHRESEPDEPIRAMLADDEASEPTS